MTCFDCLKSLKKIIIISFCENGFGGNELLSKTVSGSQMSGFDCLKSLQTKQNKPNETKQTNKQTSKNISFSLNCFGGNSLLSKTVSGSQMMCFDCLKSLQTKQNKPKQNKTKQNKTKQNKTKQNKTKQNKTKQNNKQAKKKSVLAKMVLEGIHY